MKKNFYYLSLILGLVLGMTMFTACGGDDDNGGGASGGGTSDGGAGGFTPGKFMGPKRVFGDNLLSSYGGKSSGRELTYDSNGFVTSIKNYKIDANNQKIYSGNEYKVSYSDNQVIVTHPLSSGSTRQYTITIGSNGFAETVDWGSGEISTYEYDSEGHVTRFKAKDVDEDGEGEWPYIGTLTWQDGNMIKPSDNDGGTHRTINITYSQTSNIAGIFVRASIGGDVSDFYDDMLYYMGLLGKGTANLVQSYSYINTSTYSPSSSASENAWTLDAAGRPTKCVTTTTESGSSTPTTSTYFWTYR